MGVQDRRDAMEALKGVEAIFFDVFGTVVDWQGGVSQELNRHYEGLLGSERMSRISRLSLRTHLLCSRLDCFRQRVARRVLCNYVRTLTLHLPLSQWSVESHTLIINRFNSGVVLLKVVLVL